jgi:hypothetical protein
MSKSDLSQEEIEHYANLETKSPTEAMEYVTELMGIGKDMYYDYFYPIIKDEFIPIFINLEEETASNVQIPTYRLDETIAEFKRNFVKNVERVRKNKTTDFR